MIHKSKSERKNYKLLLLAVLFATVVLACGCLLLQNNSINTTQNAYAANQATFSLGKVVTHYISISGSGGAYDPLDYDEMSEYQPGQENVEATLNANKLQIYTTNNRQQESVYADLSAKIIVPAWYEYEIEYTFDIAMKKIGGMNWAYYQFYDFDGDEKNGENAGFVFSWNGATSPADYTRLAEHDAREKLTASAAYQTHQLKYSYTYTNASSNPLTKIQNYGTLAVCGSTTSLNSYIDYYVVMSYKVITETKLSVTKPMKDSTVFAYNGTAQTYIPTFPELTDARRMQLTSDSADLSQTDAGTYTIKYEPIAPYPWDDGTYDPVVFDFVIHKGDLDIGISYDGQGKSRFESAGLPKVSDITFTGENSDVAGTFAWNAAHKPSASRTAYGWSFTPTDQSNWNVKTGEEQITFVTASVSGLKVEVDDTDPTIYDRFDKNTSATLDIYLKKHIKVSVLYNDNTTKVLSADEYTVTTKEADFLIKSGGPKDEITETKTISVRVTSSDAALKGLTGSCSATVNKAVIKSMSISPSDNAQPLVYPVTLAQIKDNYDVYIGWNYFPRELLADASMIDVAVKATADNPDGVIRAGGIDLTFTYTNGTLTESEDLTDDCIIDKGTYDISGVTFEGHSVQFDGEKHTLAVTGDVKDAKTGNIISGFTYSYSYKKNGTQVSTDGVSTVGSYDVVASFVNPDFTNYNDITDTLTATLNITNSGWNMNGVKFDGLTVTYDGNDYTLEISGTLPDNRITVTYTVDGQTETSFKNAGTYEFTASFSNPDPDNYGDIADMHATLKIEKDSFDMSGVKFEGLSVTYDGNDYTLTVSGDFPDSRIEVAYTVTGQTGTSFKNAGTYEFTASFVNPDSINYEDIADMHATLKIDKATISMDGVTFEDNTVGYDGNQHTLEISGDLPEGVTVVYTVAGQTATSFSEAGIYVFTATFVNPDPDNYNDLNPAELTATLTIESEEPPIHETPPENEKPSFLDKIKAFFANLIEKHFPLWQIGTMAVAGILTLIFLIKAIQYGNRAKKAKGEAKKIRAKAYATLLPVFSTEVVAAGLTNKVWSIIAFAMVGLAVFMFAVALITRHSWKKAELAKETAVEDREERKVRADKEEREAEKRERREFQERVAQSSASGGMDTSFLERRLLEMEERHREDEERHRREMEEREARYREEQAKRDEAMKAMLAGIMGSRNVSDDDMIYGTLDDTDMLVQRVIAGLLPSIQQMVPEPTAYLAAPGESNEELLHIVEEQNAQMQAMTAQMNELQAQLASVHEIADAVIMPDNNNDEILAQMKEMQQQISKLGKSATVADNSDIVAQMNALQQQIAALNTGGEGVAVINDNSDIIAEMNAMRKQIAILAQSQYDSSVLDDEDEDIFDDDEEEWDSILDEEDDDNFVESVVIEADGTVRKTYPNFRMRLKESSDKNREWYAAIKNLFCSQKGVTYRVYKRVEKIRYQGQVIAVIGIAKRSIKLWLALKPYEYDARRYHHKDVSDKPRFVDVPLYVRVGSDRALTRAQELILALFQDFNMEARKRYNDRDIQELIFTLKHNKLLTKKQYKSMLCESIHVHDCDVLDDETAQNCIEFKNVDFIDDSVIETVKLDDIDAMFQDGNRITLEKLKKVGLVSEDCTGYTVVADKRLTKPLIIVANDFTLPAVKMIALTGGRVIKLEQVAR